ncbi:putative Uracil-DNA glycosylase [Bradyrhizobium sp. STM 3843]|uniref:UdgX family uracil-DNA binding protein n=1 Tax=Bradyrhizobium sp. STM 3843 TaxID=551947 RepID=UPI000240874F|nr:UdgX family uracil-DNA binding protein [Bradyrhizobium sp. STM 3843]CCE04076.1 putative Uracil-DNA glycosylase [Bradyrhizobium sp. STM 3843]
MHIVTLDSDTDFDGWRQAARALAMNNVKPADVTWRVQGETADLFDDQAETKLPEVPEGTFSVPASFVELAQSAILHRDQSRFGLLYRLLWRLRSNHDLMTIATDPDVAQAHAMARAVRRDEHKMHAFVRFREIGRERETRYVAWFEPEHHIVELAAPFFARRFADMPWSILTPDLCAHWDGSRVSFTPGVAKAEAPSEDRLEEVWRRYYASIFNPARLKVKAMEKEMPKKYWQNLPEASLIKPLITSATQRTGAMIAEPGTEPHKPQKRVEETAMTRKPKTKESKAYDDAGDLERLREEAAHCRACPLWKNATQTVFGEGPPHAPLMLVGEQPGDKEDLAGHPFVGPAGQMLDRALEEAGIDRTKVYVTNAVKHFKFVPRGKIRLHQKPATPEIKACRQWYEREVAAIRPALVVALGATAAQSVFGKITPVNKSRGHVVELPDGIKAIVTVHPSYLLRLPDAEAKAREYERFVEDLKLAGAAMKRSARAA